MNNHILIKTGIERDLGVIISNDLEWSQHVISATKKANRQLAIIKNSFNLPFIFFHFLSLTP